MKYSWIKAIQKNKLVQFEQLFASKLMLKSPSIQR